MKNVVEILEQLESSNGRLFKEGVLNDNVNNVLLQRVLVAALDPFIVYNVSKFKMPKADGSAGLTNAEQELGEFLDILSKLSARELVGNDARQSVERFMFNKNVLVQKWCKRILIRNLRCGIQATTINKTWPNLIKEFTVALAETLSAKTPRSGNLDDLQVPPLEYPVYVDTKLDGFRCIAIKNNGEVRFFSRNGHEKDTHPTLKRVLESAPIDNVVLDGETLSADGKFETTSSIVGSRKNVKDDSGIVYHLFDMMSLDEWNARKCSRPYVERMKQVADTVTRIDHKNVVHVKGKTINSPRELIQFYRESLDAGLEGIMVKDLNSEYIFDRSDAILKLKPTTTHEGVVTGWYGGRDGTKREGEFGGFTFTLTNGVVTKVGSGFSDVQRAEIAMNGIDHYVGKIAEVEGQFLTDDGKIRFPRFKRWRDVNDVDKSIVELSERVKNS